MRRQVILTVSEGNLEQGFTATLEIRRDGDLIKRTDKVQGKLPSVPNNLRQLIDNWAFEMGNLRAITPKGTNSSSQLTEKLKQEINNWLDSSDEEWQKLLKALKDKEYGLKRSDSEIWVIIQTGDSPELQWLQRVPWDLWSLFADEYTQAEIALTLLNWEQAKPTKYWLPSSKESQVRILAVLGNNKIGDDNKLDLKFDEENLKNLESRGAYLETLEQPSPEALRKALENNKGWHIFFFAGHSNSNLDGTIGSIEINNQGDKLNINELKNELKVAIDNGLQLAIFNSCDGLGLANQLAQLNLPRSIVMRESVPDDVAKKFLESFLTSFAHDYGQPFYTSVREARNILKNELDEKCPGASFLPVIVQRSDAVPFTWASLSGFPVGDQPEAVSYMTGEGEEEVRQGLLKEVKNEVKERQRQSPHGVLVSLSREEQQQQVQSQSNVEVQIGDSPSPSILPSTWEIIDVFYKLAGKVLILGDPGSGKTTTLLELAGYLANRADEYPSQPIPVLFDLSSWNANRQTLAEWLIDELEKKYGVYNINQEFLKNLIPLLDGLDELEPKHHQKCIQAINEFQRNELSQQLVVCCRLDDYEYSPSQLGLNGAIVLQPLDETQIRNYLTDVEHSYLWDEIRNNTSLFDLARQPLFLSIMTSASSKISFAEDEIYTPNRLFGVKLAKLSPGAI